MRSTVLLWMRVRAAMSASVGWGNSPENTASTASARSSVATPPAAAFRSATEGTAGLRGIRAAGPGKEREGSLGRALAGPSRKQRISFYSCNDPHHRQAHPHNRVQGKRVISRVDVEVCCVYNKTKN